VSRRSFYCTMENPEVNKLRYLGTTFVWGSRTNQRDAILTERNAEMGPRCQLAYYSTKPHISMAFNKGHTETNTHIHTHTHTRHPWASGQEKSYATSTQATTQKKS
jgi:hypothetical protein